MGQNTPEQELGATELTSTEPAPLGHGSFEELAAFAASLRDAVVEKRAVVGAFRERVEEINLAAAKETCLATTVIAAELFDAFPGRRLSSPISLRIIKERTLFSKAVREERPCKAIMMSRPRAGSRRGSTGDNILRHADLILMDQKGGLYWHKDRFVNPDAETLEKCAGRAWLAVKSDMYVQDLGSIEDWGKADLYPKFLLDVAAKDPAMDAAFWENLTTVITEGINTATRNLKAESESLDSVVRTNQLPR
jgi:hypothetical protein